MNENIITVEEITRMFDSCSFADKSRADIIIISIEELWKFNPNLYKIGNLPAICYLNVDHYAGMDGHIGCKFLEYSLHYLINHTGLVDTYDMIDVVCDQVYEDTRVTISIDSTDDYAVIGFTHYIRELSDALDMVLDRYFKDYLLINQLTDFTQDIYLKNRYLIINIDCTYYDKDKQNLTLMAKKFTR